MIAAPFAKLEDLKASLPEHCLRQFEKKFDEFVALLESRRPGFTKLRSEGAFKAYSKKDDEFVIQYSENTLEHPLDVVVACESNLARRLKYDDVLEKVELLREVSEHFSVVRSQMKSKFVVIAPRDFVTYRVHGYLDAGTFLDLHFTPDDYDHPKTKAVRGFVDMQAWLISRVAENKTHISLYAKVDPAVKLVPQFFVERGARDSLGCLKNLENFLDRQAARKKSA